MSKYSKLFAPAALALTPVMAGGAAVATVAVSAPANAQQSPEYIGPNCIRDDFGFCVKQQPPERTQQSRPQEQQRVQVQSQSSTYVYDTMISYCGGHQWPDRWGQQLDRRIRGSLSGSVFEPMGSPYGRFRAQQDAACRAGEQMYNLSVQYNGWENVPPDMQRSAERAWYMATQLGPRRDLERGFNQTWRNQQERWADKLIKP